MSGKKFLYMEVYQTLKAQILSGELHPEDNLTVCSSSEK